MRDFRLSRGIGYDIILQILTEYSRGYVFPETLVLSEEKSRMVPLTRWTGAGESEARKRAVPNAGQRTAELVRFAGVVWRAPGREGLA